MKKIALLALTLLVSATFTTASADKKKEKKKKKTQKVEVVSNPIALVTSRDSLSYALGYAAADGMKPYLLRQYNVDTTLVADFEEGFTTALKHVGDENYRTRQAGVMMADLFMERILPMNTEAFVGTPDSVDTAVFTQAFLAAVRSDTTVFNKRSAAELARTRTQEVKAEKEAAYRIENTQWLVNNREQEGVVTTASGLQYRVIRQGDGPIPTEQQTVKVKYEGRLIDGTIFDSSYQRNPQTTEFRCNQVIRGWTEALTMMPVGSEWELYIPQELGYGARQQGKHIKPYSTLIFKVELVEIVK